MSEVMTLPEVEDRSHGNASLLVDPNTLRSVPWAGSGSYKVGEVLCESYWIPEKAPQTVTPRYACRQQIGRLKDAGFKIKVGFEFEFRLEDAETAKPVFDANDVFNHMVVGMNEDYLFGAAKYFGEIGINVDKIHTEYAPGQFELTTEPEEGIKAADDTFIMKQGLKEMASRRGLAANFMTKPDPNFSANSLHFNHSLWTWDDCNAFYDKDGDHGLSDVARHWIAGLLTHCKALTAFCSPSVNCYRRLHNIWTPHNLSWGVEDRISTFRVKCNSPASTCIEDRLVGGVANPYLVIAAHIAAGLDGIHRKLECPPPGQRDTPEVPHTLDDALKALAEDSILTDALGIQLCNWFIMIKRQFECVKLKDCDVKGSDPDHYHMERLLYSKWMWGARVLCGRVW